MSSKDVITGALTIDFRKRVFALDVLRGIAILLVLPHHSIIPNGSVGWLGPVRNFFLSFGWTGVDLFFVLSGFLIGGLLFREIQDNATLNGRRFLTRRALKLWPGYFALVGWAILKAWRHGELNIHTVWPQFLQVQNYTGMLVPVTWSLAVEEHFYLILVAALGLLAARKPRLVSSHFGELAIMVIGLTAMWRSIQPLFIPYTVRSGYIPTHIRIDSLLFGVLMGHTATFRPELWQRVLKHPLLLFGLGLCLLWPPLFFDKERYYWTHTTGYTCLYIGYGAILAGSLGLQQQFAQAESASRVRSFARLLLSPIAWVGVFSYGIYLWHVDFAQQPVWFHVLPHLHYFSSPIRWLLAMSIYIFLAIGVGVTMTYMIEVPVLKLRDRFFPRAGSGSHRRPDVALQPIEMGAAAAVSL